jgi:carbonic anhydrase/acetyltransferase-like protein (isoleucine patch superfamily)
MATRTVVDSVPVVDGPPPDLARLEDRLQTLRGRFPGAHFGRYLAWVPVVDEDAHVAPTAAVVGQVTLDAEASVWYGCVLRGDVNEIRVGARSNLQDGTVVHVGDRDPTVLEADVVVGHRAVVHGCHVGAGTLVGIQATILDGARIGEGSLVGAGAVVTAGTEVPPRSLVLGTPARVVRTLDEGDEAFHRKLAAKYCRLATNYRRG